MTASKKKCDVKIKPILFNTEMVEAILNGRKAMTRRTVKPQPRMVCFDGRLQLDDDENVLIAEGSDGELIQIVPPYRPGDILYVRETWCYYWGLYWHKAGLKVDENGYCEDGCWINDAASPGGKKWLATKAPEKWAPSIHMPREAARIYLRVTDVRVERLQEIRLRDFIQEGMKLDGGIAKTCQSYDTRFGVFWGQYHQARRPRQVRLGGQSVGMVISFERCEKPTWGGGELRQHE